MTKHSLLNERGGSKKCCVAGIHFSFLSILKDLCSARTLSFQSLFRDSLRAKNKIVNNSNKEIINQFPNWPKLAESQLSVIYHS